MKVHFYFLATAFMSEARYRLKVRIGDKLTLTEVNRPDLAAHLVNKYSRSISIVEDGFGYIADMPNNAVLALQYAIHRQTPPPPSAEELDAIVASGTTDLHIIRQELGSYSETMSVEDLFQEDAVGKNLKICFTRFPKLVLHNGDDICVEFSAGGVRRDFLKRALDGELSDFEVKMLKGISLLRRGSQNKYMGLLSHGMLKPGDLAKAIHRAVSSTEHGWEPMVEWLRENGYDREASEAIARKALL